ncbi:MAG: hypothetical protein AB1641_02350 [Thermodesulfobacteriota bacterium]
MKISWMAILLVLALTLTGCLDSIGAVRSVGVQRSSDERGNPIVEENIGKIVPNKTTATDLVGLFGMPVRTETLGKNTIYVYEHCRSTSTGLSALGMGQSGSSEKCNRLTVTLDPQTDLVKNHNWQKVF